MRKLMMFYSLVLGVVVMANSSMATDIPALSLPPLQYPLAQVTISVLHQTGRGIPGGYEITLGGDGHSAYVQTSIGEMAKAPITPLSKENFVKLLNEFYRIRFFELADDYSVKKSVVLQENATVATVAMKLVDMSSDVLCVRLGDFKKCVTIVDNQPAEAARLVTEIKELFVHS